MGRHREFDVEKALDAVMCVFWRKGYEGASYGDLTEATGVERPGLYSAFGNKEALFNKALERYYEQHLGFVAQALCLPTAQAVAEEILFRSIELHTRYPEQPGCLGVNGVLAASDDAEPVRLSVIAARARVEEQLRDRFEKAKADGDLPAGAEPEALAAYLLAVVHGLAVQAKAGFSRDKLRTVASQALFAWPKSNAA